MTLRWLKWFQDCFCYKEIVLFTAKVVVKRERRVESTNYFRSTTAQLVSPGLQVIHVPIVQKAWKA